MFDPDPEPPFGPEEGNPDGNDPQEGDYNENNNGCEGDPE
jgi:hypothetical protein